LKAGNNVEYPEAIMSWLSEVVGIDENQFVVEPMQGASSSLVSNVSVDGKALYVLRLHTNKEWLAKEPDLVTHEQHVLQLMSDSAIKVPAYIASFKQDYQAILMSYVPGSVILKPASADSWISAMAEVLYRIHSSHIESFGWHYQSWTRADQVLIPGWTRNPELWNKAKQVLKAGSREYEPVLIHRDFHPVNILWEEDTVSGVVDWVNSCLGPAGVDIAHCRLNLVMMYGLETADSFLASYSRQNPGYEHDVYWDIDAIFGCLPAPEFYPPWQDFGLAKIPQDKLGSRVEALLASVV
jgi:aminoglycoside phosphotransferase (APT) family kinase protein